MRGDEGRQRDDDVTFALTRSEVDFPLGPGSWLVSVELKLSRAPVDFGRDELDSI